jgi:hypothetical protein
VSKKYAKEVQKHIDDNKPLDEDIGEIHNRTDKVFTAKFGNKMEADIKVVDTDSGPWIDATLFDNGSEQVTIEPQYTLLGEYPFEYNDKRYVVKLY